MPRNFAFGVDFTLLLFFAVMISALGVYVSPGYSIQLPLTVHRILYGSSFDGRNEDTTRR